MSGSIGTTGMGAGAGAAPKPATRAALRSLQSEMVGARDAQIARVVAMVDALAQRGQADDVIAPLRARLAQLRPARKLNFLRLLFTPLDPAIVPAQRWRKAPLLIPRSALSALGDVVREGIGTAAAQVEALIANKLADDQAALATGGEFLWPIAARALLAAAKAAPPPGWEEATGLPGSAFQPMATMAGAVLEGGVALAHLAARRSPPQELTMEAGALLAAASRHGPQAGGCMLSVMLARLHDAAAVLAAAQKVGTRTEAAVDTALDQMQAALPATIAGEPSFAAEGIAQAAATLQGLLEGAGPERREKVEAMRRRTDTACRERFKAALDQDLLRPLEKTGDLSDDAANEMEETARDLRRLDAAARRLGGASEYDARLREGAARVASMPLPLVDRVRLLEILTGPEAALALLRRPPAAA